jgi:hypothetical protein
MPMTRQMSLFSHLCALTILLLGVGFPISRVGAQADDPTPTATSAAAYYLATAILEHFSPRPACVGEGPGVRGKLSLALWSDTTTLSRCQAQVYTARFHDPIHHPYQVAHARVARIG